MKKLSQQEVELLKRLFELRKEGKETSHLISSQDYHDLLVRLSAQVRNTERRKEREKAEQERRDAAKPCVPQGQPDLDALDLNDLLDLDDIKPEP